MQHKPIPYSRHRQNMLRATGIQLDLPAQALNGLSEQPNIAWVPRFPDGLHQLASAEYTPISLDQQVQQFELPW